MSDGTSDGTLPLQDFNVGRLSSALVLVKVSGGLLLAANDGVHGREPWFLPLP